MRRPFREFKVGERVRILDDRREPWQPTDEMQIKEVHNHGYQRGIGHSQSLTMTNGEMYSAWWFDPAARCPWARLPSALSNP